jgi:uncharacterized protein YebE (UPF0316 family)
MNVVNIKTDEYEVYIGRNPVYGDPKWGNPFEIGKHGTRKEVIELYEHWLWQQPDLVSDLMSLDGKVLGCHCKPKSCHGDMIVKMIQALKNAEIILKKF